MWSEEENPCVPPHTCLCHSSPNNSTFSVWLVREVSITNLPWRHFGIRQKCWFYCLNYWVGLNSWDFLFLFFMYQKIQSSILKGIMAFVMKTSGQIQKHVFLCFLLSFPGTSKTLPRMKYVCIVYWLLSIRHSSLKCTSKNKTENDLFKNIDVNPQNDYLAPSYSTYMHVVRIKYNSEIRKERSDL